MLKLICAIGLLLSLFVNKAAAETWECAIDLQQGDRGTLSLDKQNKRVDGSLKFERNKSEFEQEIDGRWDNQEVDLQRYVAEGKVEPMVGIAVRVGSLQVKMGGRHGDDLNGVWSADCDLVSSRDTSSTVTGTDDESAAEQAVPPSLSLRATPFRPSSRQKVSLSAQAFHPKGVESITFFLNDKKVHTCDSNQCQTSVGPLRAGSYEWHAIAKSKDGIENEKQVDIIRVSNLGPVAACTIEGLATGAAVARSSTARLELTGLAGAGDVKRTANFDAGTYRFTGLPPGRYRLSISLPSDTGLLVSPSNTLLSCSAQEVIKQNFVFQ